jgi:Na+(H+)/acetate symporter ActP
MTPPATGPTIDYWIVAFSAITVLVTVWMGFWSAKRSRTASDFFVAGRSVSVGWNASAISGEYLSAASFMGVAGMVMSAGYDALWYPVCYACGYLFLLLFIAGPLRRFGAYTIPDFAEGRFDSPRFRRIAVIFVLFIGFFYTMPQMKGAGTTLAYIFPDLPYWAGVVLVGAIITLNVALGGMKGITLVQAFQYWAKMFAISVPIFVLMAVYGHYGKHLGINDPAKKVGLSTPNSSAANFESVHRQPLPEKAPTDGTWVSPFGPLTTKAAKAAGLSAEQARPLSLLYTYSLIIALVCGTAGLPHILVRFYTNPDGVAAKRTTMWVMILIGVFYLFPPMFGVMGRNLMPELYNGLSGVRGTDGIVLRLPTILADRFGKVGSILSGVTCAGAFAAFMSTFSGLLVSMTGAMAHDVYGRILRPQATAEQRLRMFKMSAVGIGLVAIGLGTLVKDFEINFMVGQAFAIAASSYFPLLFMAVWWRGLTMRGAATGMLTGGLLAVLAISLTSYTTFVTATAASYTQRPMPGWLTTLKANSLETFWAAHPVLRILCEQPALWAVPTALLVMVLVSKLSRQDVPKDIRMKMLVLHAPETLGLKQEYIQEHKG